MTKKAFNELPTIAKQSFESTMALVERAGVEGSIRRRLLGLWKWRAWEIARYVNVDSRGFVSKFDTYATKEGPTYWRTYAAAVNNRFSKETGGVHTGTSFW